MIKTLSKYGNSRAIILDKALLELLEITEKTRLKITTDGKSLVITPLAPQTENVLSASSTQHITDTKNAELAENFESNLVNNQRKAFEFLSTMGHEEFKAMQIESMDLVRKFNKKYNYEKRQKDVFENPAYKAELDLLQKEYADGTIQTEEFHNKLMSLTKKYDPELVEIQKELGVEYSKIGAKYRGTSVEEKTSE